MVTLARKRKREKERIYNNKFAIAFAYGCLNRGLALTCGSLGTVTFTFRIRIIII